MSETFIGRKRVRKSFGKIREVAEMPNLIEVQKSSYDYFLQATEPDGGRDNTGLQSVFTSVFVSVSISLPPSFHDASLNIIPESACASRAVEVTETGSLQGK